MGEHVVQAGQRVACAVGQGLARLDGEVVPPSHKVVSAADADKVGTRSKMVLKRFGMLACVG